MASVVAQPVSQQTCTRTITVYLDLSSTMTGKLSAPTGQAPLNRVASMLERLLASSERFAKDGDAVRIVVFGEDAIELLAVEKLSSDNRADLATVLSSLASKGWKTAAGLPSDRDLDGFVLKTDFSPVLGDIRERVAGATDLHREIFIIASDFVHDQTNQCQIELQQRHFKEALTEFAHDTNVKSAFAKSKAGISRAQILLLTLQPRPICPEKADLAIPPQVIGGLKPWTTDIPNFNQVNVEKLAQLVESRFATPATIIEVRHTGSDTLAVKVSNPGCDSIEVSALSLRTKEDVGFTKALPEEITILPGGEKDISFNDVRLTNWRDRELLIQPVTRGNSASFSFWNGDVLEAEFEPRLYPRLIGDGQMVVIVRAKVHASEAHRYRFTIDELANAPKDGKVQEYVDVDVRPSGERTEDREYVLEYDAPDSVLADLEKRESLTMTVDPASSGKFVSTTGAGKKQTTQKPETGLDGRLAKWVAPLGLLVLILCMCLPKGKLKRPVWQRFVDAASVSTVPGLILGTIAALTDFPGIGPDGIRIAVPVLIYAFTSGLMTFAATREFLLYDWERVMANLNFSEQVKKRDQLLPLVWVLAIFTFIAVAAILFKFLPPNAQVVGGRP